MLLTNLVTPTPSQTKFAMLLTGGVRVTQEESTLMLDGIHVVDFSQYLAGAGVTRMLAELGADITKVEIGPTGDGLSLIHI